LKFTFYDYPHPVLYTALFQKERNNKITSVNKKNCRLTNHFIPEQDNLQDGDKFIFTDKMLEKQINLFL